MDGRALDLGSHGDKLPGALRMGCESADIVQDPATTPWPFESNTFDYVRINEPLAKDVDFASLVDELHRVCIPGAFIDVRVPFRRTWDGLWHIPRWLCDLCSVQQVRSVARLRFSVVVVSTERRGLAGRLAKSVRYLDGRLVPYFLRHPFGYERFWAGIYPIEHVHAVLRVNK
jgi:hypothetical protein